MSQSAPRASWRSVRSACTASGKSNCRQRGRAEASPMASCSRPALRPAPLPPSSSAISTIPTAGLRGWPRTRATTSCLRSSVPNQVLYTSRRSRLMQQVETAAPHHEEAEVTPQRLTHETTRRLVGAGVQLQPWLLATGALLVVGLIGLLLRMFGGFQPQEWSYVASLYAYIMTISQSAPVVA